MKNTPARLLLIAALLLALLPLASACHSKPENALLAEDIQAEQIEKIIVTMPAGQLEGAEVASKTITDPAAISAMTAAFNNATVGEPVPESELFPGDGSTYTFYQDGQILHTFIANVTDPTRLKVNGVYHYVDYGEVGNTPFEVYYSD